MITFTESGTPLTVEGTDYVTFDAVKAAHFSDLRKKVFHYGVMGHYNTCGVTSAGCVAAVM